jgi:hypothetical protein
MEDDLLFPSGRQQESSNTPAVSPIFPDTKCASSSRNPMFTSSTYSSDPYVPTSSMEKINTSSPESYHYDAPHPLDTDSVADPLDHSKLRNAWQEMLSTRWLSEQPTSVLPLYLSTIFEDYRALPALEIVMPPGTISSAGKRPRKNSDIGTTVSDHDQLDPMSFHLRPTTVKDEDNSSVRPGEASPSRFLKALAPMHLARMVHTVRACKEAISEAYATLYKPDLMKVTTQSSLREHFDTQNSKHVGKEPDKNTIRDEFEIAWFNWER